MISKKVATKTPEKSRFGKLVAYLLDPQGKKTRVGEVAITNWVSSDTTWASREIAATHRRSVRAKSDRTYHLLISLRAGENPDAKTLRVIEERFCNVHIHVAINKIHPVTLTLHDRVRDYKKPSKLRQRYREGQEDQRGALGSPSRRRPKNCSALWNAFHNGPFAIQSNPYNDWSNS
jgi:hypothetical protein